MTRINELLGKVNRLYISKRTINGVYLSPLGESDIQILLHRHSLPAAEKMNFCGFREAAGAFPGTLHGFFYYTPHPRSCQAGGVLRLSCADKPGAAPGLDNRPS